MVYIVKTLILSLIIFSSLNIVYAGDIVYYKGKATHYGPYTSDKELDEEGFYENGLNVGCTAVKDKNKVWDFILSQGSYKSATQPNIVWPKIPLFAVSERYYSYDDCWKKIIVKSTIRNTIVEGYIVDVCGMSNCGWKKDVESTYLDVFGEYTWRTLGGNNENGIIDLEIVFPGKQPTGQKAQTVSSASVVKAYDANNPHVGKLLAGVSKDAQMINNDALDNFQTAIEYDIVLTQQDLNANYKISSDVIAIQTLITDTIANAVLYNEIESIQTTANNVGGSICDSNIENGDNELLQKCLDQYSSSVQGLGLQKQVINMSCKGVECSSIPGWLVGIIVTIILIAVGFAVVAIYSYYNKKWLFSPSKVGHSALNNEARSKMGPSKPLGSADSMNKPQPPQRRNIRHDPFSEYNKQDEYDSIITTNSSTKGKVTQKVSLK